MQPLLQVRGLSKGFPGVRALSDVSLDLHSREILAVIGENGAGKSTLMKILAGLQPPDSGSIALDGVETRIDSVRRATELGIALIHQELNLADNLDIAANLFLGREPRRGGLFLDRRRAWDEAAKLLARVGLDESPRTLVHRLSIGRRQMVEIAKALSIDARVLIMDEPTSSLSLHETENLYRVIRDCRDAGVSVIYISHRLGEVKELADRVVVLRDGRNAGELAREEIAHDSMVRLMVGRDIATDRAERTSARGEVALRVSGLRTPANPTRTVDFEVRAGEIVGMAGLVGAGRTEILEALFGVTPALAGEIRVGGELVRVGSPRDAIRAGIALLPEDRKAKGLVIDFAVRENISLASVGRDSRAGFLDFGKERALSAETIDRLSIKTRDDRQAIRDLSGGNQQKAALGKWLAMKPRVLLLDEPTRGVDIGAKREIYRLMERLAESGVAILFVSSEMEEVLVMSDRALVVHEGRVAGELPRAELSEEAVMRLATGLDAAARESA